MHSAPDQLLEQFENFQISAPSFHHLDHIRVAFAMLDKYDFIDACTLYAGTIRAMANNVGMPEKFNATITFAFMSLVAERKTEMECKDIGAFLTANPDLHDKNILKRWYTETRLTSTIARNQFLLPDKTER